MAGFKGNLDVFLAGHAGTQAGHPNKSLTQPGLEVIFNQLRPENQLGLV